MPNFVLIGYRGAGKTTVGRLLAERLNRAFFDTDDEVVRRAGKPIAAIFAEDGEGVFRELEAAVIAEVRGSPPLVLSIGGGAVLRQENIARLRDLGTVVWLRADAGTLWSRILRDAATTQSRPPLTRLSGLAEVHQLLAEREPLYRRAAHFEVDAFVDDPAVIVERVLACEQS